MKIKNIVLILFCLFTSIECYSYTPYSLKAFQDLKNLSLNDTLSFHKRILWLYPDLEKNNEQPVYSAIPANEEKMLFIAETPTFKWINNEMRIPCDVIKYIKSSHEYLFSKYKILRKNAISILEILTTDNIEQTLFEAKEKEYESILDEIKSILELVEKAYPEDLRNPDRIAIYKFKFSEEFTQIATDKKYKPSGSIKVFKIQFPDGNWIAIMENVLKGYLNFVSEPEVLEHPSNDDSTYTVELKRELSPIEACLSDLKLQMIGQTGKVNKETIRPVIIRPIIDFDRLIEIPRPFPNPRPFPDPYNPPGDTPEGPRPDPVRPDYFNFNRGVINIGRISNLGAINLGSY